MSDNEYVLQCKDIVKSFSGVTVLDHVKLSIRKGEIHALMGENGAGKSTIIKIITGVYSMDSGEIEFKGKPVKINSKQDSQNLGISTVFQELSLIPSLTVAENIMLGREKKTKFGFLDAKYRLEQVQKIIDRYQFDIDASEIVENLSIAKRQIVEILKGLSMDAALLILDEPTASLTSAESNHLFEIVHSLTKEGVSILYISHRLEEVYAHADVVTVFRDGKYVDTYKKEEITPKNIIKAMIGKELGSENIYASPSNNTGKIPLMQVKNLTVKGSVQNADFDLYPGEVLGLSGLVGSGRSEVLRAIFGADKTATGEITIGQKSYKMGSIQRAIRSGLGMVPEDRTLEGFVPMSSEKNNIISANFDWINSGKFFVNNAKEKEISAKMIDSMNIKPAVPDANVINLSGGNQQKVVLGKWLARDLKILLVDEPTAGVDVGAKDEIYGLIEELKRKGAAVLLVSSDLAELLRLSNRILVLRNGKIIREIPGGQVNEEELLAIASGLEG